MTHQESTKKVLLTYSSFLALFLGTGFVSGAIVHSGNLADVSKYIVIGIVGVALFIIGSFIQENILNKDNLKAEGSVRFFLYSLLLSIGVGAISGGTQHFTDFPVYSSYLIPLGLVLSWFAFVLKNNFNFTKNILITGGVITISAVPLFFGLSSYANQLVKTNAECKTSFNPLIISVQASGGHPDTNNCPLGADQREMNAMHTNHSQQNSNSGAVTHDMSSMVTGDKSFLQEMIPHHIEAINTSKIIVQSTKDAELKAFAEKVIIDQTTEVTMMKTLYKGLVGSDYADNSTYVPMMTDMNSKMDTDLDKAYIAGMIGHHDGAISMAKKILPISKSTEVKTLAQNIITNQANEIEILNNWLKTKFGASANQAQPKTVTPTVHSDGHSGH